MAEARAKAGENKSTTYAISAEHPRRAYVLRYKVVDLDALVPSQLDSLDPNPEYPPELQPRQRNRLASRRQISDIAHNLSPASLTSDTNHLQIGAPIVGSDNLVESGNARVLALRIARDAAPERYREYMEEVNSRATELGLSDQAEGLKTPVLVRERITPVNRPAFAREANQDEGLGTSPVEDAWREAGAIPDWVLARLGALGEQNPDRNIDALLNSPQFHDAVLAYIGSLPKNELGGLVNKDATRLNAIGKHRFKAALFAKVYNGPHAHKLTEVFLEDDEATRNIENAMFNTLRSMGELKGKIAKGRLPTSVDITDDLATAAAKLVAIRTAGLTVEDYLSQHSFGWETPLTPLQKDILRFLDENKRSPKKMREVLHSYATLAERQRPPGQTTMIATPDLGKSEIFAEVMRRHQEFEGAQQEMTHRSDAGFFADREFDVSTRYKPEFAKRNEAARRQQREGRRSAMGRQRRGGF